MFGVDDMALAALASAGIGGLVSLWNGNQQANAAKEAGGLQADAANRAIDLQKEQSQPWIDAGRSALPQVQALVNDPNYFHFDQNQFQQDPGYQFRLKEGLKALENSAAARGTWLGSNHLRAMNNYAQESASQEYQNAFNRYQSERTARLNGLQSLAGVGQSAGQNYASNVGNLGVGAANALAEGRTGAANASASGYVGTTNALTNALNGYINYSQSQAMMNKLFGKGTGSTGDTTPTNGYSYNPMNVPVMPGQNTVFNPRRVPFVGE